MTSLVAAKEFTYATRRLQAGDTFDASARDARVLIAIKKASLPAPASEPAVPEQASKPEVKAPDPAPVAPEDDAPLSDDADLEALRTEATTLGIEVDRRWKQARLAKEIAAAKPAED